MLDYVPSEPYVASIFLNFILLSLKIVIWEALTEIKLLEIKIGMLVTRLQLRIAYYFNFFIVHILFYVILTSSNIVRNNKKQRWRSNFTARMFQSRALLQILIKFSRLASRMKVSEGEIYFFFTLEVLKVLAPGKKYTHMKTLKGARTLRVLAPLKRSIYSEQTYLGFKEDFINRGIVSAEVSCYESI